MAVSNSSSSRGNSISGHPAESRSIKIGIDGRLFSAHRTGIGRYVVELSRCLDRLLPNASFVARSPWPIELPPISDRWTLQTDRVWPLKLGSSVWFKLRTGAMCAKDKIDVYWGGYGQLPFLPKSTRGLLSVYDLNRFVVPHTMTLRSRISQALWLNGDLRRADAVVAISAGTADRLKKYFGIAGAAVVRPAVSEQFRPQDSETVARVIAKYRLMRPYYLAVATWEPRKNLALLIDVFHELLRAGQIGDHSLVLVGGRGWKDKRIAKLFAKYGPDNLRAVGFVPDSDLAALYAGSTALVFPSLYEGFGIPVLEARACGANVVTTDLPELREAGGTHAIYIQPTREGIADGLLRATQLDCARDTEIWSWEDSARALASLLLSQSA